MPMSRRHLLQMHSNAKRVLLDSSLPAHLKEFAKRVKDKAEVLIELQNAARRAALRRDKADPTLKD